MEANKIIIFNANDVKECNENGIKLKRKYGKLKREVYEFEIQKK